MRRQRRHLVNLHVKELGFVHRSEHITPSHCLLRERLSVPSPFALPTHTVFPMLAHATKSTRAKAIRLPKYESPQDRSPNDCECITHKRSDRCVLWRDSEHGRMAGEKRDEAFRQQEEGTCSTLRLP
nr:hypothetical protein CFP56_67585 [Quercus suber]